MKTKFFVILGALLIAGAAQAQNIQYPVAELGNCQNEQACKIYCDKPANGDACISFAEKNGLMSEEEIAKAKKFLAAGETGPGGCTGKDECETYCNDMAHMDECISFAEKNGLMSGQELAEAKKMQAAIARGVKAPACKNKAECDSYCEDPNHMEECISFGMEAGFIQGKEAEDAQKMLEAIKRGVKPLPCKGKQACDEYCNNADNMEKCMNFAMEAGLMSEEEKTGAQGMLKALKQGIKPPPCKGKEECDAYCQTDEHIEECINFSIAAGMMDEKDAEMAKKTKGKGPGGCKSKEECEAFCKDLANQETCFNFAKDNGMISEEELQKMEEGKQQTKKMLEQATPEVLDCLNNAIGADVVEKMKQGYMPPRDLSNEMQGCFGKMGGQQGGPGEGGMIPPQGQTGPGGCKTAEECQAYCEAHQDECQEFNAPKSDDGHKPDEHAGEPSMGPGPGGCQSEAECEAYCSAHREECGAPSGGPQPGMPPQGQPCEGENCQQGPQPGPQQMQPGTMQPQGQPCTGEDCQQGPMPGGQEFQPQQPGTMPPKGQMQPPPEGMMPPADQQPQQPSGETPPSPPTSLLNSDSLLGSFLYILAHAIYSLK